MASVETITTAQQLLEMPDPGRCELIRGELIHMPPTGFDHGWHEYQIAHFLGKFVIPRKLGVILVGDVGFLIERDPDTVRAPDVAFIRTERIPQKTSGFYFGVPDLAVEILSPSDRAGEVQAKVDVWLSAGCPMVWVVDPENCVLHLHRRDSRVVEVLTPKDTLTAEEILPGFSLPLSELFQ
jgi:Uma2 family endonuclease